MVPFLRAWFRGFPKFFRLGFHAAGLRFEGCWGAILERPFGMMGGPYSVVGCRLSVRECARCD